MSKIKHIASQLKVMAENGWDPDAEWEEVSLPAKYKTEGFSLRRIPSSRIPIKKPIYRYELYRGDKRILEPRNLSEATAHISFLLKKKPNS